MFKLSVKNNDYKIDGVKKCDGTHGEHIFINAIEWLDIVINDTIELHAEWQNGHTYLYNDYNYPSNDFVIYEENSHPLLNKLYDMYEKDFEDKILVSDLLSFAKKYIPDATEENLFTLRQFLNDSEPVLSQMNVEI